MDPDAWPFDQDPNCAVISTRSIVTGGSPILYVSHDAQDHGWQFLDGGTPKMADAMVVGLEEIVELDGTVLEVADLPPGWHAERMSAGAPWSRQRS